MMVVVPTSAEWSEEQLLQTIRSSSGCFGVGNAGLREHAEIVITVRKLHPDEVDVIERRDRDEDECLICFGYIEKYASCKHCETRKKYLENNK